MTPAQIDVALRLAAIVILLLLAWLLFRDRARIGLPALLFAPMALCLSGFVAGNTPDPALRPAGTVGAIAHFASGCTVVFLWYFCLACFDPRFRPRGAVLAAGLLWLALAAADRLTALPFLSPVLVALGFAIVAHLVWRLWADREGDLVERRHDARITVALLLGGLLLADLLVDLVLGFAWRPRAFALAQNATVLGFGLWLAGRILDARAGVLSFDSAPETSLSARNEIADAAADAALHARLAALIEDGIHLDPDLTFAGFVQRMSAPEKAVRRLVNHALGFDHFRAFLNHHRVVEAKRRLGDPARASDKVIAIALDSGFASLPSFNRVFRELEGCTPSAYRAAALAGAAAPPPESRPGFEQRSAVF
ncbi:AraC family transcriptional regulator [Sphingomonas parva]|uniref:AraC family transcriptional regulator n=1 Tax=Sphingomonas parva TaxID=2555898 RepID=A0A4Y8ZQJ7_9SPHN|nr:helix-turn-helix domain-containing protein [Sphingomonas parva]TFI57415.1 AraC family transcriptional regulator [Sphingomonas parva]